MLAVLHCLSYHAGTSDFAFPSVDRIIDETKICKSRVYDALQKLRSRQIIVETVDEQGRIGHFLCPQIAENLSADRGRKNPGCADGPILIRDKGRDNEEHRFAEAGPIDLAKIRNLRRVAPKAVDQAPPPPRSEADRSVLEFLSWLQGTYFVEFQNTHAVRNTVRTLTTMYGSIEKLREATKRAVSEKKILCKDGRRFTVSTILFYARYYDKTLDNEAKQDEAARKTNKADNIAYIRNLLELGNFGLARYYVGLYGLSWDEVRTIFGDDWTDKLLDEDIY